MWFLWSSVSLAQAIPEGPPACFPECSPGYLCHEGACIQACNPACPETERCTEERICVSRGAIAAPDPEPAADGELCFLREKRFVASMAMVPLELDAVQFGLLGNGRVLCSAVPAGPHRLTLMLGEVGHHFETTIAPGATTYFQWTVKNAQTLAPMDPTAGERLRLGLLPAKAEHLTFGR